MSSRPWRCCRTHNENEIGNLHRAFSWDLPPGLPLWVCISLLSTPSSSHTWWIAFYLCGVQTRWSCNTCLSTPVLSSLMRTKFSVAYKALISRDPAVLLQAPAWPSFCPLGWLSLHRKARLLPLLEPVHPLPWVCPSFLPLRFPQLTPNSHFTPNTNVSSTGKPLSIPSPDKACAARTPPAPATPLTSLDLCVSVLISWMIFSPLEHKIREHRLFAVGLPHYLQCWAHNRPLINIAPLLKKFLALEWHSVSSNPTSTTW